MHFIKEIEAYSPQNEQEYADRELILSLIDQFGDAVLTRNCRAAHMTSSGFIVNEQRDKTLMAYHNIYQSWAWTGGHADGESELLPVALREAMEETGITKVAAFSPEIASIDVLTVPAHIKRGKFVSAHLHLSVCYLLIAPEDQPIAAKEDENSGVRWLPLDRLAEFCSEPVMLPVYEKLIKKMRIL
ncbi:NUDIX hydrolase [Oscillospiraceae bacterium PP1C4]